MSRALPGRHPGWGRIVRGWIGCGRRGPESGRVLVLALGLLSVVLALAIVTAGATSLHLERKRLVALTDSAAADAADALDSPAYFRALAEGREPGAPGAPVPISDATVRDAVRGFLAEVPAQQVGRLDELAVAEPTGSPDGSTAQVTLRARLRPALLPPELDYLLPGVTAEVTSTARAG